MNWRTRLENFFYWRQKTVRDWKAIHEILKKGTYMDCAVLKYFDIEDGAPLDSDDWKPIAITIVDGKLAEFFLEGVPQKIGRIARFPLGRSEIVLVEASMKGTLLGMPKSVHLLAVFPVKGKQPEYFYLARLGNSLESLGLTG